jgi:hypothetical protein
MIRPMRRVVFVFFVAALALLDGCGCRKKSDEEKLRAAIDATPVHLWLSAKIALHPDSEDEKTREARKAMLSLIDAAQKKDAGVIDIGPKEAATIAVALWELRGLGKEAFKKDKRDVPKPVLVPLLFSKSKDPAPPGAEEALAQILDANTEHALFLIGLTVAKIHPKLAVPVPPEILLYEAWWSDAKELPLQTLAPTVRSFKAYVYGTSALCDLAEREASAVPSDSNLYSDEALAHDLRVLTGQDVELPKQAPDQIGAAMSGVANGATAICYFERDEPEKANAPLRRTLDAADRLGVEGRETDFLRGYVECADGDASLGEKKLKKIVADKEAPKRLHDAAEILVARCGKGKGAMAKVLDRLALASALSMLALHHVEESGILDSVAASKLARTIVGLTTVVSGSLDRAKSSIPTYEKAKDGVKGLLH